MLIVLISQIKLLCSDKQHKILSLKSVLILAESAASSLSWPIRQKFHAKYFWSTTWIFINYSAWKINWQHLVVAEISGRKCVKLKINLPLQNLNLSLLFHVYYLPRRRRPGTGDIATPPICLSVCLSVCPSRLVFALLLKNALMYFLQTLQVRVPCHGGVLYSFLYWRNVVWIFYEFFKYWVLEICFQYFMFSSRFMLFPTLKKN